MRTESFDEAEWYEKETAENNTDTQKLAALITLRQSALIALCSGISAEYASRFVKEVMDEGVPDGWCVGSTTPHTLRHTCGTWLAQRGVPMWEIAGYLGMTVETASSVYLHHSPEHLRNAADAVRKKV